MEKMRINLNGVFWKEDGRWFVQLLETGLIGDGATHREAMSCVINALVTQVEAVVESGNFLALFSPADPEMFQMYAAGTDIVQGECHLEIDSVRQELQDRASVDGLTFEDVHMREYTGRALALA